MLLAFNATLKQPTFLKQNISLEVVLFVIVLAIQLKLLTFVTFSLIFLNLTEIFLVELD
jgi:hypothetical protein